MASCRRPSRSKRWRTCISRRSARQQPHGPYLLGGYSGGGVVALEMARKLAEAGERIDGGRAARHVPPARRRRAQVSWREHVERLSSQQGLPYLRRHRRARSSTRHFVWARQDRRLRAHSEARRAGSARAARVASRHDASSTRCRRHVPGPYAGKVTLFRAQEIGSMLRACRAAAGMGRDGAAESRRDRGSRRPRFAGARAERARARRRPRRRAQRGSRDVSTSSDREQRYVGQEGDSWRLTRGFSIGNGSLLAGCGDVLLRQGQKIAAVVTSEPAIEQWASENGIRVEPSDIRSRRPPARAWSSITWRASRTCRSSRPRRLRLVRGARRQLSRRSAARARRPQRHELGDPSRRDRRTA